MRIGEITKIEPARDSIFFPRDNHPKGGLLFVVEAVTSMKEYRELCPDVKVPQRLNRKGEMEPDPKNPEYRKRIQKQSDNYTNYLISKGLLATENLHWDTIDFDDPDTWGNYKDELEAFGLTEIEIGQIVGLVIRVNAFDSKYLDEAKARFLQLQQMEDVPPTSQEEEQTPTSFGDSASDSE